MNCRATLLLLSVLSAVSGAAGAQAGEWRFVARDNRFGQDCVATFSSENGMIRLGFDGRSHQPWMVFGSTSIPLEAPPSAAESDEPGRSRVHVGIEQSGQAPRRISARLGWFPTEGRLRAMKFLNQQVAKGRSRVLNFIVVEDYMGGIEVSSLPFVADGFRTVEDRVDFRITLLDKVVFEGGWQDGGELRKWLEQCTLR